MAIACCQCARASPDASSVDNHRRKPVSSEVDTVVNSLGRNIIEKLNDLVPPLLDLAMMRRVRGLAL